MPRPVVVFASLATVGALASLAYLHASRIGTDLPGEAAPRPSGPSIVERERNSMVSANPSEATRLVTPGNVVPNDVVPNNVAQWVADIRSDDAQTRAAAIAALAGAPKEQAVPALVYVVESGEPQVDRQIALLSLRTLAVNDGDSDGAIRDVIRKAMYHTDDDGVMQSAQALLEDIEAEFAERTHDAAKSPSGEDAAR